MAVFLAILVVMSVAGTFMAFVLGVASLLMAAQKTHSGHR